MKNSDMKIIAIILSIALFLTIVTSNAVSIASVVFLAKDAATAQQGTVGDAGTATTPDAGTATTPDAGTATTPDAGTATTPDAGTATTPDAGTATTPDAGTATPEATQPSGDANKPDANKPAGDANKPAGDANKPAGDANKPAASATLTSDQALAMYQKAAKEINTKGVAGYTKKGWQAVEGQLQLSKFGFLAGTLTDLIGKFMTPEAEAEEKVNAKGSDDAKNRMPISDCSKSYIKSVTPKTEGDNYVITIVMNDQVNPSYEDKDGLVKMSKEFLDIKDVKKTVVEDPTVSKVVSKLDGTINYKAYTITAKMTKDGKFIDIVHYGVGDIKADLTAVAVGDLSASGALSFNAHYYDFKY